MSVTETTPEVLKSALRTLTQLPLSIKAAVYAGNKSGGPAITVQFNSDVRLYGVYEALLFVENYERDGFYTKGTAEAAIKAILTTTLGKAIMANPGQKIRKTLQTVSIDDL